MLPRDKRISSLAFGGLENISFTSTPFFSIKTTPSDDHARVAVVVSKKVAATARLRNTLRRRLYADISDMYDNLTPSLIVVVVNKKVVSLGRDDMRSALCDALAKARVLKVR